MCRLRFGLPPNHGSSGRQPNMHGEDTLDDAVLPNAPNLVATLLGRPNNRLPSPGTSLRAATARPCGEAARPPQRRSEDQLLSRNRQILVRGSPRSRTIRRPRSRANRCPPSRDAGRRKLPASGRATRGAPTSSSRCGFARATTRIPKVTAKGRRARSAAYRSADASPAACPRIRGRAGIDSATRWPGGERCSNIRVVHLLSGRFRCL
jgi:hypothetical protein